MTDTNELVKRLRTDADYWREMDPERSYTFDKGADVITSLQAELEAVKSKLANAVEALDRVDRSLTNLQPKIANGLVSKEWVPVFDGYIDPAVEAVRTTLAELTGGKHD